MAGRGLFPSLALAGALGMVAGDAPAAQQPDRGDSHPQQAATATGLPLGAPLRLRLEIADPAGALHAEDPPDATAATQDHESFVPHASPATRPFSRGLPSHALRQPAPRAAKRAPSSVLNDEPKLGFAVELGNGGSDVLTYRFTENLRMRLTSRSKRLLELEWEIE
jgi:hypothetical protein